MIFDREYFWRTFMVEGQPVGVHFRHIQGGWDISARPWGKPNAPPLVNVRSTKLANGLSHIKQQLELR